jgi:hypothetical protein
MLPELSSTRMMSTGQDDVDRLFDELGVGFGDCALFARRTARRASGRNDAAQVGALACAAVGRAAGGVTGVGSALTWAIAAAICASRTTTLQAQHEQRC